MTDLIERREVFRVLFDGHGGQVPDAPRLHALARRRLAREALEDVTHLLDRRLGQPGLVRELLTFARSTWPEWQSLPEARALSRREWIDHHLPALKRAVIVSVVGRRLRDELAYVRWTRQGV